jgi:VIT1/CCC1 family predicted Fe2+/Mn2+ transporter
LTIALSYIVGGLIPLSPYFFVTEALDGLKGSIVVTAIALYIFGFIKGKFTTPHPWRSAWQTVVVGGLAAGAAFFIAQLFEKV